MERQPMMHRSGEPRYNLDRLLQLTQAMLAEAESGDWDRVDALEQQRQQGLEHFMERSSDQQKMQVMTQLRTMLALDQTIVALAEAARSETGDALRTHDQGRRACTAYGRYG